jgi:protease I
MIRLFSLESGCKARQPRAGGRWVDREVVEDGNWVSSRQPSDLPAFNRALIHLFARRLVASRP